MARKHGFFRPHVSGLTAISSTTMKDAGGYTFVNSEAAALVARFTTPPTNARKVLIDNFYTAIKLVGLSKFDAIYMLAAADAQSSLLNWVQDAYNLTAVNSPAFVVDRGYTGDGSTSYLDTGFNPTTAVGAKFVQDSGALSVWSRTNLANGAGTSFDFGSPNSYVGRSTTAGQGTGRPNAGSGQSYGLLVYPGYVGYSRTAAAVWEAYAAGVDSGGGTTVSAAPTNATLRICSIGAGSFGVNQIATALIASGLSAAEELATYNALNTYLQAIGAA
jgi:hypothetical protein